MEQQAGWLNLGLTVSLFMDVKSFLCVLFIFNSFLIIIAMVYDTEECAIKVQCVMQLIIVTHSQLLPNLCKEPKSHT